MKFTIAVTLLAFALVVVTGCETGITQNDINSQKKTVEKEQEQLDAMKKRQKVEGEYETKLADLKKKIDQLEEQVDEAKGEREVQLRGEIAMLHTKHKQVKDQLTELRAASGDAWAQIKVKTDEAWNDATEAVEQKMKEWNKDDDSDRKPNEKDDSKDSEPDPKDG